jgi:hypothetical protein
MSTDPTAGAAGAPAPGGQPGQPGQPSEEELRAAYEAELSRITSADMMLQAAVSLLNIGSFRLAPKQPQPGAGQAPPSVAGDDLEQVRDAIDGVRALLEILERRIPNELKPLRDALSQLQMAYAREAQAAAPPAQAGAPAAQGAPPQPPASEPQTPAGGAEAGQQGQAEGPAEQGKSGPGPAESSGRLWVPGR